MTLRLRKAALTAHIAFSVGWLGAIVAFLVLSIYALASDDVATVRVAYEALERMGWVVLLPFSAASLVSAVLQSLVSPWGLFRHYWVLFKLVINVVATIVLVMYTATLAELARVAADEPAALDAGGRWSPVLHAAGALILLLFATALAVYKPRGLTPWGREKQQAHPRTEATAALQHRR